MRLRLLWAWLLFSIISIQWIIGVVYVKISHSYLMEVEMNEKETALAESIAQEYGVISNVRIIDEDELQANQQSGYAATFIFSTALEDSALYFALETDLTQVLSHEEIFYQPKEQQDTEKSMLSLHQLFSIYVLNRGAVLQPREMVNFNTPNFIYLIQGDLFDIQIPTPPPSFLV
ncbi:MAG: hypothetical protein R2828_30670 [Saprospiraceae bacterium]